MQCARLEAVWKRLEAWIPSSCLEEDPGTCQGAREVAPAPDGKVIEQQQLNRLPKGDPADDDQALA